MKNFAVDEYTFCKDMDDLLDHLSFTTPDDIEDDFEIEVEFCDIEPIFTGLTPEYLCELLACANEDRLDEDFTQEKKVISALKESIDFEKLNLLLPKLWYGNGKTQVVTKVDLVKLM